MTNINFACFLFSLLLLLSSISKWISIFSCSEGYEYPWWRNGEKASSGNERKENTKTTKCLQIHTHFSCLLVAAFLGFHASARERMSGREFDREQGKSSGTTSQRGNKFVQQGTDFTFTLDKTTSSRTRWMKNKEKLLWCVGGEEGWWKWARNCSTFQLSSLPKLKKGEKLIFGRIKISAQLETWARLQKGSVGSTQSF